MSTKDELISELRLDIAYHLECIETLFKIPVKVTVYIRSDEDNSKDILMTNDAADQLPDRIRRFLDSKHKRIESDVP